MVIFIWLNSYFNQSIYHYLLLLFRYCIYIVAQPF
nr:MAG TPA: hypothetical protein [Bacteriophage sp.]